MTRLSLASGFSSKIRRIGRVSTLVNLSPAIQRFAQYEAFVALKWLVACNFDIMTFAKEA